MKLKMYRILLERNIQMTRAGGKITTGSDEVGRNIIHKVAEVNALGTDPGEIPWSIQNALLLNFIFSPSCDR